MMFSVMKAAALLLLLAAAACGTGGGGGVDASSSAAIRSGGTGGSSSWRLFRDQQQQRCPGSIVAVGDSTTDTGNAVRTADKALFAAAERAPYGDTYFGQPSGRFCDGRVMADIVSQALGLGLIPPHLSLDDDDAAAAAGKTTTKPLLSQNFAVAGATALDAQDLQRLANGATSVTPFNLGAQVSQLLDTLRSSSANYSSSLAPLLAFVGEIGGNDYNYANLRETRPDAVISQLVPAVVNEVRSQLDRLLSSAKPHGLRYMLVLGQFPMGCVSLYQSMAGANATRDRHGCVAAVSAVTDAHDRLLRLAIDELRLKHPDVQIVFFDVGAAFHNVLDHAAGFGFDDTLHPCYTGGLAGLLPHEGPPAAAAPSPPPPPKLVAAAAAAGTGNDDVCKDPSAFVNWDGVHFTEAMHRALVVHMLYGGPTYSHPFPSFLSNCV